MRRASTTTAALALACVFLAGCDSVAPSLSCKVEVDTPKLISEREAAGVDDCDWATEGADGTAGVEADLPDVTLDCLGGETGRSLRDVRGPAVLSFWSSNCVPCREEMPVLQEFHEQYGDQVAMIGVNYLDLQPEMAIDLARITGVTYPSVADACGDLQETDMKLAPGLPFFLFIDADGSVSIPHTGGITKLQEIVDLVEENLDIDVTAAPKGAGR